MLDLTPGERRALLVLLALFALGTVADLRGPRMAPAPEAVVMTTGEPAPGPAEPGPTEAATPAAAPAPSRSGRKRPPPEPVDLATATPGQLQALPGIGPVLAQRIVRFRSQLGGFHHVEDLRGVPGVGPWLYERIRPHVRVGPAGATVQSAAPRGADRAFSGSVTPRDGRCP